MTSKQRAFLKSLAMNIAPTVQVGKSGLTPDVTRSVEEGFNTKELIKISLQQNCAESIQEVAEVLAERTGSVVVQTIGRKIVLYKEGKGNKKKIILPKAASGANNG